MFQRMMDVSGCQTTAELAEELGVYESVLLEIQRDKKMPYHILGFCLDLFHASPLWIMFGVEPCRLEHTENMDVREKIDRIVEARELMRLASQR